MRFQQVKQTILQEFAGVSSSPEGSSLTQSLGLFVCLFVCKTTSNEFL